MASSSKKTKKKEKDDVTEAAAVVDEIQEDRDASAELPLTVHAQDRQWTFHCDEDEPLVNTLFIPLENSIGGKCILHYDSTSQGNVILDRTKTPSFYGMIYDDDIYLGAIIRISDDE